VRSGLHKGNENRDRQESALEQASYVPTNGPVWRRDVVYDHRASEGFIYIWGAARPLWAPAFAPLRAQEFASHVAKNSFIFTEP